MSDDPDRITCPYCDGFEAPNTDGADGGKLARVQHILQRHDPPLRWDQDLQEHDESEAIET